MSEVIQTKEKKKRGRKPKILVEKKEENLPLIEKKKRGRKPKPKTDVNEVKIPKKRGRKPLDANKNVEINKNVNLTEENVILHLPIKTNEINNINYESLIIKYNPELTVPVPFAENNNYQIVNIENLENSNNKSNENKKNIIQCNKLPNNLNLNLDNSKQNSEENKVDKKSLEINETMPFNDSNICNKDVIEKFENITNKYNNISIYEKNKVLPILLEYSETNKNNKWPNSVSSCCYWCTEQFDSVPVGIPIKKLYNTFYMFGNFCSPECAAAYIFDNKRFMNDCWEKYSMLNLIYSNLEPIKIAPSRVCLKKFGGRLSINEFRNICTKLNKSYKLLLPPMVSVLPMIEEINLNDDCNNIDMFLLNKEQINKANEEYRLRRNKPLPDSKNTLESCMNLKVL